MSRGEMLFEVVQVVIEQFADAYVERAEEAVQEESAARAAELDRVASGRAQIELVGAQAFGRLLGLHGESGSFDWREYIAEVMYVEFLRLFPEFDDRRGGGDAAMPHRTRPRGPRGGLTMDDLGDMAQLMATHHVDAVIGSWSAGPDLLGDIHREAVLEGLDRCRRLWDAERGPLFTYLNVSVWSTVKEEFRNLVKDKAGALELREAGRLALLEHARGVGREDPAVERVAVIDAWAACPGNLSVAERAEWDRRRAGGAPATDGKRVQAYKRALKKIREGLGPDSGQRLAS